MPLRVKALFAVGATFVALFLGVYLLTRLVVLAGFREYEDQEARRAVQRVLAALNDDLVTLKGTTRDWAGSDDAYRFMEERNAGSLRANLLGEAAAINNRIGLMVLVDREGRVVLQKAYDLHARQDRPVPAELTDHLTADRLLAQVGRTDGSLLGLLGLGRAVVLVAVEPIVTSGRQGPPRGALVFGRQFDAAELQHLARTTLSSLEAYALADLRLPAEVRALLAGRPASDPIVVRPLDPETLVGYAILRDVYGEPALVLGARMPREVFARARLALVYLMVALAAMGLGVGALAVLLLERGLLTRLRGLAAHVEGIARSGDTAGRVPASGAGDELARLGDAINGLLRALGRAGGGERQARVVGRELEEGVAHAQTMEALGRLAGGLARDFNNLLVVVMGRLAQLEKTLPADSEPHRQVRVIQRAAGRAAALTEQLVAFSHRQVTGEQRTDVDALLRGLEGRLREVAGERVAVRTVLHGEGERARVAPFQLEEVLLNLASNARDAMPQGGTLCIETGTADLGAAFVRKHPGAHPGPHVVIRVRDDGMGMDDETRARAFEPFFTTKGVEEGTGLGLAAAYSIVKQADGYIGLESAPGRGTTFTIYLPVAGGRVTAASGR
jgi:signal transduction histidine kinase